MKDFRAHVLVLTEISLSIWFVSWAWRRKSGDTERLDSAAQVLRWIAVAMAYAITFVPGADLAWLRVTFLLVGLAFIAWPNLACAVRGLMNGREQRNGTHGPERR